VGYYARPELGRRTPVVLYFATSRGACRGSRARIEFARERNPLSLAINTDLGFHYYYTCQYDEAIKQLQSVLTMNHDFAPAHLGLGRSYQQIGRFNDAITEFRRVEQSAPEWPIAIAARGSVEGAASRPEKAKAVLAELQEVTKRRFVTAMAWPSFMPESAMPRPPSLGSTGLSPSARTGWYGCALIRVLTVYEPIRGSPNCSIGSNFLKGKA
jgi:tetratricopeptide (TPR) repeat protein